MNNRYTNMDKKEANISVIVPIYNVEEVISDTLKSLTDQTFQNFEVLLIDDGSTDNTVKVIDELIHYYPHFKLIKQRNSGPAAARNHGLRKAKGEYICFVDSDDVLPKYALELMYHSAIKNDADLVTGATKRFNSKQEWFIPSHLRYNIAKPGAKTIDKNPELFYSIGPCAKLYHRSLIENCFFPESIRYGEDQPFVLRALLNAKTIYTVEKVVYYYRLREGETQSITQSVSKDPLLILQSVFNVFDFGEKIIKENNVSSATAIKYYERVASMELWTVLKAVTESKNANIQISCYEMMLAWFKTKSSDFLNLVSSFRYLLLHSMIARTNFIRKKAKPAYKELISYLWNEQVSEAKAAFKKNNPAHSAAALDIIEKNKWMKARKVSLYFQLRVKSKMSRLTVYFGRRMVFKFASILPRKNYVVLATNRSTRLEGNLRAIYNYMFLNDRPERIYIFLRKTRNWFEIIQLYYVLGRAKTIALDDYYNQIYGLTFNKKTNVVQSWHAAGAFKKFGISALGAGDSNTREFEEKAHSPYSEVLSSSPNIIPQYAEAFHKKEEKIVPIGVPRTDVFFDEDYKKYIAEVYRRRYPILRHKKAILYAPTFRGGPDERHNYSVALDLKEMKEKLSDEYVLFLKFHPLIKNVSLNVEKNDPFFIFANQNDINNLMLCSDLLITDYSSVIFEYSLLNRPMFFFAHDVEDYFDERGFYFNYYEMVPGGIYTKTTELVNAIKNNAYDYTKLSAFREKFVSSLDGRSTERFVNRYIKRGAKK